MSKQGTSAFPWQGWRRQLKEDAQHHALMEQQDAERFTPQQIKQLNALRARFLQEGGTSTLTNFQSLAEARSSYIFHVAGS